MKVSEQQRSVRRRDVLKALGFIPAAWRAGGKHDISPPPLVFCCSAANDLYKLPSSSAKSFPRYDAPEQAVARAAHGSGVLILADGYPDKTTQLDSEVFQLAAKRKLRMYVEYPSFLPDLQVGEPQGIAKGRYNNLLERVFVASDAFNPSL